MADSQTAFTQLLGVPLESVIGNMIKRVLRLVRDAYDQYVLIP
jgi:hypothetical protein